MSKVTVVILLKMRKVEKMVMMKRFTKILQN